MDTIRIPIPGAEPLVFEGTAECATWPYWRTALARPEASWRSKINSFLEIIDVLRAHNVRSVIETCAGLGVFASLVERRLECFHVLIDVDPNAVQFLTSHLQPGKRINLHVMQGDAGKLIKRFHRVADSAVTEAIIIDYSRWTLYRYWRDVIAWESAVFCDVTTRLLPALIVVTDSASSKFHLNRERYSEVFGRPIETKEDYFAEYEVKAPAYRVLSTHPFSTLGGGGTHVILKRRDVK